MKKRNFTLISIALMALIVIAAEETIREWKMTNGDTCYTWFASIACTEPGGTLPPVVTATPGSTATPTRTSVTPTSSPTLPSATPSATPTRTFFTATPASVALVNGNFESDWQTGWSFVNMWPDIPSLNNERGDPQSRFDGAQSFRAWNNFRCVMMALYQKVTVTKFDNYIFTAWGRTWSSDGVFPNGNDPQTFDGIAVGIDPSGGTNPFSGNVIWAENFHSDTGVLVSVQTTALNSAITVFVRGRMGVRDPAGTSCEWPHTSMMIFLDGASIGVAP